MQVRQRRERKKELQRKGGRTERGRASEEKKKRKKLRSLALLSLCPLSQLSLLFVLRPSLFSRSHTGQQREHAKPLSSPVQAAMASDDECPDGKSRRKSSCRCSAIDGGGVAGSRDRAKQVKALAATLLSAISPLKHPDPKAMFSCVSSKRELRNRMRESRPN